MSNSRFIGRVLATDAGLGPLALRIAVGVIFVAHGAQKLFGWFGGYGPEGTGQFFGSMGLNPGVLMAFAGVDITQTAVSASRIAVDTFAAYPLAGPVPVTFTATSTLDSALVATVDVLIIN
jgi:uncharacterized membrane protein YphA (DoxX/SURF4 family)